MSHIVGCYCLWDNIKSKTFMEAVALISSGTFQSLFVSSGSLLPHTRNQAIVDIYNRNIEFTHICFIDGDMANITPEIVAELLKADKDLISPVMTRRVPPFSPAMSKEDYPALFKELEKPLPERVPIPVLSSGFGCTLIKKKVLDALMEKTEGTGVVWFPSDRMVRKTFWKEVNEELDVLSVREWKSPEISEMLKEAYQEGVKKGISSQIGGALMGEDIEFCTRMRMKGFQPWVHSGLYISHLGDQEYNIKDYIDFCNMKGNAELRVEVSKVSVWNPARKELIEKVYGET